jgi:hypothetical protein
VERRKGVFCLILIKGGGDKPPMPRSWWRDRFFSGRIPSSEEITKYREEEEKENKKQKKS